jgi:hypothetical protein
VPKFFQIAPVKGRRKTCKLIGHASFKKYVGEVIDLLKTQRPQRNMAEQPPHTILKRKYVELLIAPH